MDVHARIRDIADPAVLLPVAAVETSDPAVHLTAAAVETPDPAVVLAAVAVDVHAESATPPIRRCSCRSRR